MKTNFPLIIRGAVSGFLLILGPLFAIIVKLGNANTGIIITIGLIFEAIGLGIFWLVIRKEYLAGEEREEEEDAPFQKIRSKFFKKTKKPEE